MVTEAREQRLIAESLARSIQDTHRQITGKGLVINHGEGVGAITWGNHWSETFCAPPPQQWVGVGVCVTGAGADNVWNKAIHNIGGSEVSSDPPFRGQF